MNDVLFQKCSEKDCSAQPGYFVIVMIKIIDKILELKTKFGAYLYTSGVCT